ncbi:ETX/MTX2 family pore-forming toxin [Bacillus toyonensis]|uniref:ETX/MTX2 family pore-forming toxin n=1 Tax=Bacillus toyonensis TaxID=155322 RepID=UPI000BF0AC21|nr:hypothetical protein CN636_06440 [Bacillus toyonensis]
MKMAITDIESAAKDYMNWALPHYSGYSPTSYKFYPYTISNVSAVPAQTAFETAPVQKAASVQVVTNNTSLTQSQTLKFSEKLIESTTGSTTEGYKIGSGITSTSKFSYNVKIFAANIGFDQTFTVTTTGEYNHSSTETTTKTTEKLWELTQPVSVPPYTQIVATLLILGADLQIPMTLNAFLLGNGTEIGSENLYCSAYYYNPNYTLQPYYAGNMANRSWPNRPDCFYQGVYSLQLQGASTTSHGPGLYATVLFEQTPLPGFETFSESKTWYSNEVLLRDGSIITIPDLDPATGRVLPAKVLEPVMVSRSSND